MQLERIPARTKWEPQIGYSRAIRAGSAVSVSGTVALDRTGDIVGYGDAYQQTRCVLEHIREALAQLDCRMEQVIRTRVYLMRMDDWEDVGRAYAESLGDVKPVSTWVEVSRLVHPDALVEIEADAITASSE